MLNSNGGSSPQNGINNFFEEKKAWWTQCPLFTKVIVYVGISIGILGIFTGLPDVLVNNGETFENFQITRLITSPFATKIIAELIVSFIFFIPSIAEQEKRWGTLKNIVEFFVKNIEINIVFLILRWILVFFISKYFSRIESYGLWCLYVFRLAEQVLDNPEGSSPVLSSSLQVPNKYYPIALFLGFSIISNAIRIDIVAAFLAGVIHIKFLEQYYFQYIDDRKIAAWESSTIVGYIKSLPNFIPVGTVPSDEIINDYDSSVVRKAGSPEEQENNGYGEGFAMFGGGAGKKYAQMEQVDIEDLSNDIEKQ